MTADLAWNITYGEHIEICRTWIVLALSSHVFFVQNMATLAYTWGKLFFFPFRINDLFRETLYRHRVKLLLGGGSRGEDCTATTAANHTSPLQIDMGKSVNDYQMSAMFWGNPWSLYEVQQWCGLEDSSSEFNETHRPGYPVKFLGRWCGSRSFVDL